MGVGVGRVRGLGQRRGRLGDGRGYHRRLRAKGGMSCDSLATGEVGEGLSV